MQFAMKKMVKKFKKATGIDCELVVSSSGKHTAQILQGAPYHIFLSADKKYPGVLYEQGFSEKLPLTYGYGQLVLWTTNKKVEASVSEMTKEEVKRIGVPDPNLAPYGSAALEVLRRHKIYDSIEQKLVFAESVSQVNHFILTGAVGLGFTSLSSVISKEVKNKGKWIQLSNSSYTPIAQDAIVLTKNNTSLAASNKFMDFILSKEGGKILKEFGYLLPDEVTQARI